MRNAFISQLNELAQKEESLVLLAGDIGFKVFDKFRDSYPDRFFNCGIAEANMVGMSAGLAMAGFRPFVYTIIPFLTMRAFEQIRVDLCMHNQPVILVGVGGGLAYDVLGPTHHAIEDVAIMRALPNMTVIVPSDPEEVKQAIIEAYALKKPVYIRLGKNGEPQLTNNSYLDFKIGRARILREGRDVAIIGCGPILKIALDAAEILMAQGLSCQVVDMHTIKPLDAHQIVETGHKVRAMITIEEHNVIGGLGSAVSEVISENNLNLSFKRFGLKDAFVLDVGNQKYLLEKAKLTSKIIVDWLASKILQI